MLSFPLFSLALSAVVDLAANRGATLASKAVTNSELKEQCFAAMKRREAAQAGVPEALQRIQRLSIPNDPMFLDEAAAITAQAFPISADELILTAKKFLYMGQGTLAPDMLASDFVFMGPFVGGASGLSREDYLDAVGGFNLKAAFPDLNPRFHHFRLDPLDAGRVWFTSQASGTDSGSGFLGNAPTGKSFSTPPQACSLKFNKEGIAVKYTIGAVMERSMGNTGGLGGIFGPAYAIGKPLPFPEAKPWKPSKRYRMLQLVGAFLTRLKKSKK
mmetsp:Transcript_19453/g.44714  ORF Transcript_19453/g.44714 Transcript_19453/m.44714 type:complete len:273 (-) Transcript_19453:278-1096(-)